MNTVADWYPGDRAVFAGLDVLGFITILVVLTWGAERFLARRCAALRHTLWLSALVGVLLTPALAWIGQRVPWRVGVLPQRNVAPAGPEERPVHEATALPPARAGAPAGAQIGDQSPSTGSSGPQETFSSGEYAATILPRTEAPLSGSASPAGILNETPVVVEEPSLPALNFRHAIATLACFVWGLGSVYLLFHLLHGGWRVRRLRRHLRPLDSERWAAERQAVARVLSVARLPEIHISPDTRSPLVAGLVPSRVILPEALVQRSTPDQIRAILVHECAHVIRGDPWIRLLQRLAAVLFWFHPLVHRLNLQLDRAREEVGDNHVLGCIDAPAYAATLLTVAQICYPIPRSVGYLTMIPHHDNLERRVVDLLEERRDTATRLPPLQWGVILTSLILLLAAASSIGLQSSAKAQDKKTAPASSAVALPREQPTKATGMKLTGQVIRTDGSPAVGAVVWAAKFTYSPLQRRETVAGADGRYTLNLDPGHWHLWARHGTQGGEGLGPHEPVHITTNRAPEPVAIHLEERGTFRGRLLAAETGKPIAGAQLFLDAGLILTTGADGRFAVGGLFRGNHEAYTVAPGRIRMCVLFDTTARADTELDIPVSRSGKIVGRVTDRGGQPIPGAYVGQSVSGSYFSINGLYSACDAEGRFEYDVVPDQATRLIAFAPGYVEENHFGVRVPLDAKPLELRFQLRPQPGLRANAAAPDEEKRRLVSGVVHGPDAKPVAGVVVRWGYEPVANAIQTQTDAAGRFRLTVPDKANLLAVLPHDFTPEFPRVVAGGDQKVEVALRQGKTSRGRVIDDTGKPIQGVRVIPAVPSLDPRIGNPFWLSEASVDTDAEGNYELRGVPEGARFDFLKSGLSDVRNYRPDLGAAGNTVTMLYGGALKGRVVDRDGKPIRNFRLLVGFPRERRPGDKSGGFFSGYGIGVHFTSDDGGFVLTGVGAGTVCRLTAVAQGHGEAVADRVTAVPVNRLDKTEPVTLRAGLAGALRVRVVTADAKPIGGARVTLVRGEPSRDRHFTWGYHDVDWENSVRQRTAPTGWANFPALSFGAATVLVEAPGYGRYGTAWRNGEKELKVQLTPEAVLTGEVRDAAGVPVKQVHITLVSNGHQILASVGPDAKGRFRVAELPAGNWTIEVRDAEGRSTLYQAQVTLKVGETKELKIEVKTEMP